MPIITPQEVRDYTAFDDVKNRTDEQLEMDILQASMDIFYYVGHRFDDPTKYPPYPPEVKLAFIKVTEYYALTNSDQSGARGYKSEKIGNYAYQLGDGANKVLLDFSLKHLLNGHIAIMGNNGVRFRLRSL